MFIGTKFLIGKLGILVFSHHIRNDISTYSGLSGISIKKLITVMCTLVPYIRHCVLATARTELVKRNMVVYPMV
jgi:hypothetical protein